MVTSPLEAHLLGEPLGGLCPSDRDPPKILRLIEQYNGFGACEVGRTLRTGVFRLPSKCLLECLSDPLNRDLRQ